MYIYTYAVRALVRTLRSMIQVPKILADEAHGVVAHDGFSSLPDFVSHLLRTYLAQRKVEVR